MNRKKYVLSLVALGVLTLACLGQGMAGTLQDVKARGKLVAGVRTDLPPFGFVDKKGVANGIDIDIARALAKGLFGKEDAVEFFAVTKTNGISFLNAKEVDVLLGAIIIGESHKEVIDYSVPYFEGGHLILARNDSRVSRYQDLAGKKVATIQGSTGDITVGQLVPRAERIEFTRHSEALQALKDRRVDAFVDTNRIIIHFQRRNPKLKIAGYQPFGSVTYGLGVRRGDEEWLGYIDTTLAKMKETGQYDRLLERWFAKSMALLLGFEKPMTNDKAKNEKN
jgi:aspartate/glutamate/glutamine transport system substrate-binding protein